MIAARAPARAGWQEWARTGEGSGRWTRPRHGSRQRPPGDDYKEAVFLQRMLERHGSQEKVAARIGKSQ
ncbi:hypothetical protein ACWD6T_21085, partial [Streptomyces albidoflavus]